MSELVGRINRHSHDPAAGENPILYGQVIGTPRTFGVMSRVMAASNTVTVSAGIEAVVWGGLRYVTARVSQDVTLTGSAASNAAEYLYLSTAGVSKSTTAPVFSAADGFFVCGTDRTLRWIGVMLPRTGTVGAYTYMPTSISGHGSNASAQSYNPATLFSGSIAAYTDYNISFSQYCVSSAISGVSIRHAVPAVASTTNCFLQIWDKAKLVMLSNIGTTLPAGSMLALVANIIPDDGTYIVRCGYNIDLISEQLTSVTHRW